MVSYLAILFQTKFSIEKSVTNSVRHRSHLKWSQCRNATAVSQVTPPVESIEMVQYVQWVLFVIETES